MEIKEVLNLIEMYYRRLRKCSSLSGRRNNGFYIIGLLSEYPETKKYWEYREQEFYWEDRFVKKLDILEINQSIVITNGKVINSNSLLKNNAQDLPGCYLLGQVSFDLQTNTKYCWLKVGSSMTSIKERIKTYNTYNPSFEFIDSYDCTEALYNEKRHQAALKFVALGKHNESQEWFLVPEKLYVEALNRGFEAIALKNIIRNYK